MSRIFVVFALLMLVGVVSPVSGVSAQDDATLSLLSRLPGLESAYARKYMSPSEFGFGTPAARTPERADVVTVTVLEFATEADAQSAFKLTSGTLVAGAIIGVESDFLVKQPITGLGDEARLYLTHDDESTGILMARSGRLGVIVEGTGPGTTEQLGAVLQSFGSFVFDQKPSATPVTVVESGEATGGSFDLMPGQRDTDVLQGLVPMYDYDLLVNDSPIGATPAPTPAAPCSCSGGSGS